MGGFEEKLQKAGLTGNESRAYLELLRKGSLSANEIAKKIVMDRTLTYTVLNHLIEKGMVHYVIQGGKKIFSAANPEHLLNPIKVKEIFVNDLVLQLKEIEEIEEGKREVNVYEGTEGLRTVMKNLIKHNEICGFGATGRVYDMLYDLPYLIEEARRKRLHIRMITTTRYRKHPITKSQGISFKYLDIKSEAATVITKDMVVIFMSVHKPISIVIHNKEIAESYKNHFEVLWKAARKV